MQILESSPRSTAGIAPRLSGKIDGELHTDEAEDDRWQLALRIAASGSLGRSQLLSDFLLYIVDRSIRGRTDEITEQQIGVSVFGRPEDYDSNDDNIVRSYARKLRKRIEEYFATEGQEETLRLEIPRGGYTPIFSHVPRSEEDSDGASLTQLTESQEFEARIPAAPESAEELSHRRLVSLKKLLSSIQTTPQMLLVLLLGILIGVGSAYLGHLRIFTSGEEAASHTLWTSLFSRSQDTFIVPSDDGLIIMQRLTERPLPLPSYVNGSYRANIKIDNASDTSEILKLSGRRFTNVVDLDLATRLGQLKEVVPERMMVRYARDLRMDDLRTGNAILIGSEESNPWVELFHSQLFFSFRFESEPGKPSGFANLYPRPGESALYTTKGHEENTFGIIAYLPNLNNNGHVLIVAGLNTAGTQAAATFLLNPSSMMPTLHRAKTSKGVLQPFELLVSAGNVATNASTPHVILERIGLPPVH